MTIKQRVLKAVAEAASISVKEINASTKLINILDSLSYLELLMALDIDDNKYFTTVGGLIKHLKGRK